MDINELSSQVIGAAIEVHRHLGPGLLESTYEQCMCRELSLRGVPFECQLELPMRYKDVQLDCGYRIDIRVADALILEIKSVDELAPTHTAQLLTYLKLTGLHPGLLLNFNVRMMKDGIRRVVNDLVE
jgi:GxxExxY protein